MCLRALRPKSPTGKLDFLSNSWALEPSRTWGHEGPSSAHQQASPYLCQWVFKKMVILSVLNRLVQYITSIGTVISQQFTVRCMHWEHRRGRRKGWGSQRDILKKACWCCTLLLQWCSWLRKSHFQEWWERNSAQQSVWHSLTAHRLIFMGFLQEYASHLYEVFTLKAQLYQRAQSFYPPSSFKRATNFSATINAIHLESL